MTHSIVNDFDVDLYNNYKNRDYAGYYPHILRQQPSYKKNGKIYSSHAPGLALILSLPYLLLKKEGVIITLSLISSLFIFLFYRLLLIYLADKNKVFFITSLLMFSAPFLELYASIYPGILSGCIMLILFIDFKKEKYHFIKQSLLFLFLALFGIKFLVAGFYLWLLLCFMYQKKNTALLFKFNTSLFICILIYFLFNFIFYGEFRLFGTFFAHGRNKFVYYITLSQIYKLLTGGRFGLFFCAPIYICSIIAVIIYFKKYPVPITIFCLQVIPYFMSDATPGNSPPARYFISTLPFFALYLAMLIYNNFYRKQLLKFLFLCLYIINCTYSFFYLTLPFYRNKITDGNNFIFFLKTLFK